VGASEENPWVRGCYFNEQLTGELLT
jgi:hypothetical protein